MFNTGQACITSSRIYVHHSIRDEFLVAYQGTIRAMAQIIGSAGDEKTTHGPQTEGKVLFGGDAPDMPGFFINPTVFTDVPDTTRVSREEIFSPVSIANTFDTEEEAIKRAKDSELGLYAAVFSKNIDRALRVASPLESGSVGVKCTSPTMALDLPFGGYKQSGVGRKFGVNALSYWKEAKRVFVKLE
ncbi:Aldehyde/histidinol dehydrogenase [Pterulicium gracile]|uniref:Aldehyde/histidinol dehydrogenase n=1 Tax=Pterulicium gracile TaxID=1884261 RepID=A0A5C3QJI4_9AGAR|nr:Aldehyde/histidinol dehydrogenase [Pterula gracilis]